MVIKRIPDLIDTAVAALKWGGATPEHEELRAALQTQLAAKGHFAFLMDVEPEKLAARLGISAAGLQAVAACDAATGWFTTEDVTAWKNNAGAEFWASYQEDVFGRAPRPTCSCGAKCGGSCR